VEQSKQKRKVSFISRTIIFLNLLAVFALCLSYLSSYIPPSSFSMLPFTGLAYPYILLLNLVFIIFWLLSKKRFALISIVTILLGWNQMGRLVRINQSSSENLEVHQTKVLSYNIQNFLNINAVNTKYVDDFSNEKNIIEFIKTQNADIICLQEMLYDREKPESFPDKLGRKFNCPNYYYENYYISRKKIDAIATFTRYKIIENGHLEFEEKSIGIYNDLLIKEDTVRVYNLHLASIHLKKEDYEFMSDISNQKESENFKVSTQNILSKLKQAYLKRARQANKVTDHISACKYPVIICGDLNDTPLSYVYKNVSNNLEDAFVKSGTGFGATYAGKNFPSLRIDYIFHDKQFRSTNFKRHKVFLSDHFPISSILYMHAK